MWGMSQHIIQADMAGYLGTEPLQIESISKEVAI